MKFRISDYTPIIDLHINTCGGSIPAAFAAVDIIRNLKSDVHTYVDGGVASAGTLLSVVGKKRYMGQHAQLLIHQLSSEMYGKYAEMVDTMYNCTNVMEMLKNFYKKYTKIPSKKFDEIIKKDIWLSAEECLQYGIIDEIV
jgi:ATP-dependent protease ClpP protease subunit